MTCFATIRTMSWIQGSHSALSALTSICAYCIFSLQTKRAPHRLTMLQVLIMSDQADATRHAITTPALRGRSSFADAQSRQYEGLRMLYERRSNASWFLLVDDDTFVNVGMLRAYTALFDASNVITLKRDPKSHPR